MRLHRLLLAWLFVASLLVPDKCLAQGSVSVTGEGHSSNRVALGATLSTAGPGLNLSLEASRSLVVRLGFEQLAFSLPFSFEENEIDYSADLDYKAGSLSLMADWHYYRSLFVTLGAGYNLFHPVVDGVAGSDWQYGDITIPASEIGEFQFDVQPSIRISPYAGLGIGRKISKNRRVAFSAEAGVFYQGPPRIGIKASGLLAPTADESHGQRAYLENQLSQWRYYPVLKFALSYMIFK